MNKIIFFANFLFLISFIFGQENRRYKRDFPKKFIKKTIKLFNERNGKVIVEIGSMRVPLKHNLENEQCPFCEDGHSTLLWAECKASVFSVDINEYNIDVATKACKKYNNVKVVKEDGIVFLKKFNQKIDLLFLDAWDVIEGTDYAEKHLEAYYCAKDKLHDKSLILIDDTDVYSNKIGEMILIKDLPQEKREGSYFGKGKLLIPQLLNDGFKIIFSGRQTLLSK